MANKKNPQQHNLSPEKFIRERGRKIPLEACYLDKESLEEYGEGMGYIIRKHEGGKKTIGIFLIDKWCLGIKDAFYAARIDEDQYEELMEEMRKTSAEEVSYEELHNWIFGALEYADEAGIDPCKQFSVAKYLLEDDEDESIPIIEYEFGHNGVHHLVVDSMKDALYYLPAIYSNLGNNYKMTVRRDFMKDLDFDGQEMDYEDDYDEEEDYEDDMSDDPFGNPKWEYDHIEEPEYTYVHPEYPSSCTFNCALLEKVLTVDTKVPSANTVKRILLFDHDLLREDLEGFILKTLHDTADVTEEDVSDGRGNDHMIIATILLGEVGDEGSVDLLLEVCRQNELFHFFNFDIYGADFLTTALTRIGKTSLDKLFAFVEEPGLFSSPRIGVFAAACAIISSNPELRPEGIEHCRRILKLFTEKISEGENEVCGSGDCGFVVSDVVELGAVELEDEIKDLFATGRVDSLITGTLDDALKVMNEPSGDYFDRFHNDALTSLKHLRH